MFCKQEFSQITSSVLRYQTTIYNFTKQQDKAKNVHLFPIPMTEYQGLHTKKTHTHALPSFASRGRDTDLYDLPIPSLKETRKKKGGGKSEFLKGRLEPGKIRASRCNLLMAFVLTNLLLYEKSYALSRTQKNMKNMFICAITLKSMSIETTQKSQN